MKTTMGNLLNATPDYLVSETARGTSRRYLYESGAVFSEWTSFRTLAGRPFMQIAKGRSPETGKMAVARGFIAIGQRANGIIAIGQIATGWVAIGQIAVGGIAIGQIGVGVAALGMIAVGAAAAGGEAVGIAVFGAQAVGVFVLAAQGVGVAGKALSGWGLSRFHIVKHLFG